MKIWLPISEARSWAMLGDAENTRAAIEKAERSWDRVTGDELDELGGICTFGRTRQLYYAADALSPVLDLHPDQRNNGIIASAHRVRETLLRSRLANHAAIKIAHRLGPTSKDVFATTFTPTDRGATVSCTPSSSRNGGNNSIHWIQADRTLSCRIDRHRHVTSEIVTLMTTDCSDLTTPRARSATTVSAGLRGWPSTIGGIEGKHRASPDGGFTVRKQTMG